MQFVSNIIKNLTPNNDAPPKGESSGSKNIPPDNLLFTSQEISSQCREYNKDKENEKDLLSITLDASTSGVLSPCTSFVSVKEEKDDDSDASVARKPRLSVYLNFDPIYLDENKENEQFEHLESLIINETTSSELTALTLSDNQVIASDEFNSDLIPLSFLETSQNRKSEFSSDVTLTENQHKCEPLVNESTDKSVYETSEIFAKNLTGINDFPNEKYLINENSDKIVCEASDTSVESLVKVTSEPRTVVSSPLVTENIQTVEINTAAEKPSLLQSVKKEELSLNSSSELVESQKKLKTEELFSPTCMLEKIENLVEKIETEMSEHNEIHDTDHEKIIQQNEELQNEVKKLKARTDELESKLSEKEKEKENEHHKDGKINEELLEKIKKLEEKLAEAESKEAKFLLELKDKKNSEQEINRVMQEYEKTIARMVANNENLKKENEQIQMHLSNTEFAFSDVHQKYEKCKAAIKTFQSNEESLKQTIVLNQETIQNAEQKYTTLKTHAMVQLEKSNEELATIKKSHEIELSKLNAMMRRLEIKNSALSEALQQKTKECEQLSAVYDEFLGKVNIG